MQKSTTELLNELKNFDSFKEYEKINKNSMINKTLSQYLCDLLEEKHLKKSDVIRKGELNESYAYQMFVLMQYLKEEAMMFGVKCQLHLHRQL